jgi:hypothetical protein
LNTTAIPLPAPAGDSRLAGFLRGDVVAMAAWVRGFDARRLVFCFAVIALGAGAFGAAVGVWRSPLQALFTALKLPLVILLTTAGNGLLNGMLAPLLGLNLRFRESLLAILLSHTVAAAILGSLSPVMLFVAWNAPPLEVGGVRANLGFEVVQLFNVAIVAFAGVVANVRLLQLLDHFSAGPFAALRVLLAWLAGNLFLGAQLAWTLRPFIGAPELPVQFLRPNAFEGNFYETVLRSFSRFFTE